MTPAIEAVARLMRLSFNPPPPVAGARVMQVLQPGKRAHQLHLLRWAAAQASTLLGLLVVFFAADLIRLWSWLSFLEYFTAWNFDVTTFLPAEWRLVGVAATVGGFLLQLPLSLAGLWAERRATWYVISDQGVQLRHGLWTTHETSLRYANLQQVVLHQRPLQRLLGLADLVITTAGARQNSDDDEDEKTRRPGVLADLDLAAAHRLRDEIRSRLPGTDAPRPPAAPARPLALTAAQQALAEARALRQAVTNGSRP